MAQQEHSFSKLRLSKPTAPKRVSSTFSSIKRYDDGESEWYSTHHASSAPHLPTTLAHDDLFLASPSPLEEDLSKRLRNGEDLDDARNGQDSRGLRNGEDLDSGRSEVSDNAISATESELDSLVASLRMRGTSISFAREVTLEKGHKQVLEGPLPRSTPRDVPWAGQHGSTLIEQETESNNEESTADIEPIQNGLPLDRRKDLLRPIFTGQAQQPQIHRALEESQALENTASLTSATTASSILEEISTPLNGLLLSPTNKAASPIAFSSPQRVTGWPQTRSESTRSRSYNRLSSIMGDSSRPTERRRSQRSSRVGSTTSSMSPASAFLAQWNRGAIEETIEPDDEGQEIGDHSGWIIGRKIGYGGFSVVKEVYTMENDKRIVRAVKIVRKQPPQIKNEGENERVQEEFQHEVEIWRFLKHRYIVPLISVYDTPFATFCITRLNIGGTLHDLLRSRRQQYSGTDRGLPPIIAKRYAYQLAAAIRYLHEDVRVVHRDVKLENILLDMSAPDARQEGGNILLCDFGMADFIHNESRNAPDPSSPTQKQRNIGPAGTSSNLGGAVLENKDTSLSIMGSLEYAAPELISASTTLFSPAADIWAFGVVVYALLTGSLPFSHSMKEKLVVMIEKTQWDVSPLYQCPAIRGGGIAGLAAVELVKGCLTHDEGERWDVERILACRWLVGCKEFYGDGSGEDWS